MNTEIIALLEIYNANYYQDPATGMVVVWDANQILACKPVYNEVREMLQCLN